MFSKKTLSFALPALAAASEGLFPRFPQRASYSAAYPYAPGSTTFGIASTYSSFGSYASAPVTAFSGSGSGSGVFSSSAPRASSNGERITNICYPTNSTGGLDLDAPCNQIYRIESDCIYGEDTAFQSAIPSGGSKSSKDQQSCFCSDSGAGAGFWQYADGCMECFRLHGGDMSDGWMPTQWFDALSSSYCSASETPAPFTVFAASFVNSLSSASTSFSLGTQTPLSSDVIGTHTEVSYYFTATGAAATGGSGASSSGTGTAADGGSGASSSGTGTAASASASSSQGAAAGEREVAIGGLAIFVGAAVLMGL